MLAAAQKIGGGMTPSGFVKMAIGVMCTALLGLIAVVWSYNTGVNDKQDLRIEKVEARNGTTESDLRLVQYKQDQASAKLDAVDRKIESIDNKIDELVNQKRRDNPTAMRRTDDHKAFG